MSIASLSIADLYATKAQSKEKEAYYRSIKNISEEYAGYHAFWADLLQKADAELVAKLITLQ